MVDHFTEFYDDSSDEDDTSDGLLHEISTDIKNFIEKNGNNSRSLREKPAMITSFINFTFGLSLYNGVNVKNTYQLWKKEYLEQCMVPETSLVDTKLSNAIERAIENLVEIRQHPGASKKLAKACFQFLLETGKKNILVNCLRTNLRQIIRCIKINKPFPEHIHPCTIAINTDIVDYLKNLNYSTIIEENDFGSRLQITASNLYKEMEKYLKKHYQLELNEKNFGIEFLNTHELITPTNRQISASKKSKKNALHLSKQTDKRCEKEYFEAIYNATKGWNLDDFNNKFDEDFLIRRMQELINEEKMRGINSIIENRFIKEDANYDSSKFSPYKEYMDAFKPCTIEIFQKLVNKTIRRDGQEFDQHLISVFKKVIEKDFEPYIWRSTLPPMHIHHIKSIFDYIASFRLTHRSHCRTIRNQLHEKSILTAIKEKQRDIGWQFCNIGNSYIAIERTRITENTFTSLVQFDVAEYNYPSIGKIIRDFLQNHPTYSDKDIVLWIRQVLTCKKKLFEFDDTILPKARHTLTLFIVQLTHLFVGTESIRHPAALVQTQMIMDLIGAGRLTWFDAFTEAEDHLYYPMILDGAVNICRHLATIFNPHSFYSYKHPGKLLNINDTKRSQYINAEYRLTIEWLKLHNVTETNNNELSPDTIIKTIHEAIPYWYINPHNNS